MQNRIQRIIAATMIISVTASSKSYAQGQVTLNGAGATFPFGQGA